MGLPGIPLEQRQFPSEREQKKPANDYVLNIEC